MRPISISVIIRHSLAFRVILIRHASSVSLNIIELRWRTYFSSCWGVKHFHIRMHSLHCLNLSNRSNALRLLLIKLCSSGLLAHLSLQVRHLFLQTSYTIKQLSHLWIIWCLSRLVGVLNSILDVIWAAAKIVAKRRSRAAPYVPLRLLNLTDLLDYALPSIMIGEVLSASLWTHLLIFLIGWVSILLVIGVLRRHLLWHLRWLNLVICHLMLLVLQLRINHLFIAYECLVHVFWWSGWQWHILRSHTDHRLSVIVYLWLRRCLLLRIHLCLWIWWRRCLLFF